MIDPLFIYEVVDDREYEDKVVVAGPYRNESDAKKAIHSLCYDVLSVFLHTTEQEIVKKFRESKARLENQKYRYTIRKTKVL